MSAELFRTPHIPVRDLAGVLVIGLAAAWGCNSAPTPKGDGGTTKNGAVTETVCPPEIDEQIINNYRLHSARKWVEAIPAWKVLQSKTGLCQRQQEEIRLNLQLAENQVEKSGNQIPQWERQEGDTQGQPKEPISQMTFLDYYHEGKQIRSLAMVDLTGRGSNKSWFFKARGHFAYQSRLLAETTVKINNGTRAVFELEVVESAQLRATNQLDSLKLEWPKDLVLTNYAPLIDKGLSHFPVYRVLRGLASIANQVDPGLEKTLTLFAKQLRVDGQVLNEKDERTELVVRLGELAGQKLEIEYIRDLGITKIYVLNGKTLPVNTLASIAHNSSLLMDYYLFPATEKKEGESWSVDAADVAGLVQDGFEASAVGKLKVTRKKDTKFSGQQMASLEATSGEITLAYHSAGKAQEATIRPKTTSIVYSIEGKLIRQARLDWNAEYSRFSTDHLLFGTEELGDMQLKSYYEAEAIDVGRQQKDAK